MEYFKEIQTKWSDIDANIHLRHSVFYDYATYTRFCFFSEHGYPMDKLSEIRISPFITREEARFFREIKLLETVKVSCTINKLSKNYIRFSFEQEIFKETGKRAAVLTIEGGWLNLDSRKATRPTPELLEVINQLPRTKDFEWI